MLRPLRCRKDLFGEPAGDDSGRENVECDGVVGGENESDCLPSGLPRDRK
jgi:hypothetical protein